MWQEVEAIEIEADSEAVPVIQQGWTVEQAKATYNIAHWSDGYFDINMAGCVVALPHRRPGTAGIELAEVVQSAIESGLSLPILLRFNGILTDRVDTLCHAFQNAMLETDYHADYTAVYPIKVNQQRGVVEELIQSGDNNVGLEVGSKPELMAVLAIAQEPNTTIICNGYKDREYIRLALIGQKLGYRVYLIIEKFSELELILTEAKQMAVRPLLGVRVRLASIGKGNWQNTGGEKSKFGLTAQQVLQLIQRLQTEDCLDTLQLLHSHLGSQIANIRDIQTSMREVARYYAELRRLGANIHCVDVGGGLGVDYEGTRSRNYCSMNYSIQMYAHNIVHALKEICVSEEVPCPDIITEAGRAMTAHHAVLVTEVIDVETVATDLNVDIPTANDPAILRDLWQALMALNASSPLEVYHDACHYLTEAHSLYQHGVISLSQRARAEQLYIVICTRLRDLLNPAIRSHRDIHDELNEKLIDKYYCNFSLFQSLPDVWAINQIFPIMPLENLQQEPTRRAVIHDITCDSDGRIDTYVNGQGVMTSVALHACDANQSYCLGIFLVGAYQEILGDMHNLFGDTDSIHVEVDSTGGYRLVSPDFGDTVADVLDYVHYDSEELLSAYREKFAEADLSENEREVYLAELETGLSSYTYLAK